MWFPKYLNKSSLTLDVGPKKTLYIVPTSFSSSFLTTLWFRLVSVAGVTHQQLCFRVLFSCKSSLPLCHLRLKGWLYLCLMRRSLVSLKSPVFSWDLDAVMHALMNLCRELTTCLLFLSRPPFCCWYLLPKHGPGSRLPSYAVCHVCQINLANTNLYLSSQTV